jgi:adenylate cyclase
MNARSALACALVAATARGLAAQCPDGSPPPCGVRPAPAVTSVAVLPFDNLTRDSADLYLARQLTDEVTLRLAQVGRLTVTSASAMRRYRGDEEPQRVARAVGVAHLVGGSVRHERGRLRVGVELLRARDGVSVWTETYDRPDSALLDIQIAIATAVARAIAGRLLPQDQNRLGARPTRDARAYDHFARGRYETDRRTTRALLRAIQEFQSAIRFDSGFASAIAGEARANLFLAVLYYDSALVSVPRDSLLARGATLGQRALRLDSTSAAAWHAVSMMSPPAERRRLLERALALEPQNADVLFDYASTKEEMGDTSGLEAILQRAVAADPTRSLSLLKLGLSHFHRGRYAEAARWLDSAVALRPDAHFIFYDRAQARLRLGDTTTLRADAEEVRRLGRAAVADALLLHLAVARHDSAAVRAAVAVLHASVERLDCPRNFDCLQAALALAGAGDREGALRLLERTAPFSSLLAPWLRLPEFDGLRSDPRFQAATAAPDR